MALGVHVREDVGCGAGLLSAGLLVRK